MSRLTTGAALIDEDSAVIITAARVRNLRPTIMIVKESKSKNKEKECVKLSVSADSDVQLRRRRSFVLTISKDTERSRCKYHGSSILEKRR